MPARMQSSLARMVAAARWLGSMQAVAGGVARRPVFEQSVFQNRGNAAAIPVHKDSG